MSGKGKRIISKLIKFIYNITSNSETGVIDLYFSYDSPGLKIIKGLFNIINIF